MSRSIEDLEPETRALCTEFLQQCLHAKYPMVLVCTHRSFEEQEALYAKGRVRPGAVVTHARAGYSWHNFRRAFDVCFLIGTALHWDGPWNIPGKIGRDLGLIWGGDWNITVQDRPHFENSAGTTLAELRAKTMIPVINLRYDA